jgi:hypothetical protein
VVLPNLFFLADVHNIFVLFLSLKSVQVPFEVPGLAVLGVRHEDVALSPAIIGNWQQRQLQKQQSLAAVSSVLRPRSCRQNQSHSFTGNFLAECEFASAADFAVCAASSPAQATLVLDRRLALRCMRHDS